MTFRKYLDIQAPKYCNHLGSRTSQWRLNIKRFVCMRQVIYTPCIFIILEVYSFRLEAFFLAQKIFLGPLKVNQFFSSRCVSFPCTRESGDRRIHLCCLFRFAEASCSESEAYTDGMTRGELTPTSVGENLLLGSHSQQQNKNIAIHIFKYDFFHIQKALNSFAALFRLTLPIAHM